MSTFDAEEIEAAFVAYQDAAAHAGATGDWGPWVDLFTEDATYLEHLYGTFTGREQIRDWITSTMSVWPNSAFTSFPCEWHVLDQERGWVLTKVWNRLEDPGDGSVFEQYNLTILHYAGNGRWSHEEDIYNPEHFATVVREWIERRRSLGRADGE